MHATIRRYEGVDQNRTDELSTKISQTLAPRLSKLPGFSGYYVIETGNGVMSSLSLFENVEQCELVCGFRARRGARACRRC